MLIVAMRMMLGRRAKYFALVLGISTTAFLVTFAGCYFCGMMTRSFALVSENPGTDVWVMDPAAQCPEQATAISSQALLAVKSVEGVRYATPLILASADLRFGNGQFQSVQIIGVDDATLMGAPPMEDGSAPTALRGPDAAMVAEGGTDEKLETPSQAQDQWTHTKPHLDAPHRLLDAGDELLLNDRRIRVAGRAAAEPRFPPHPLVYMTCSNALRVLPIERTRTTFILVKAGESVLPRELADRIEKRTGLRARTSEEFKVDTVKWYMLNNEDVGDVETLLSVAMLIGLGVTGVMLFLFTQDNLRYYAMLKAMGASGRQLVMMVLTQSGICGLLGTGIGIGLCATSKYLAEAGGLPFRMMWPTPLAAGLVVGIVTLAAAGVSLWPVLKLEPAEVFKA